ncbi:MAG: hypothetical protein LKJ25_04170 [Clostridia bacterium]|jgi:hypothetical protein|nr:hypothetical protein [Clostridia bacterium]
MMKNVEVFAEQKNNLQKLRTESMYRDKCTLQVMDLCLEAACKIEHQQKEIMILRNLLKNNKNGQEKNI